MATTAESYPEFEQFITKITKQEGILNYNVQIIRKDDFGGFMGEIFFVNINNNTNVLNLVFKVGKKGDVSYNSMVRDACNNEIIFYSKIYCEMDLIQNECNLTNLLNSIPKCYGAEIIENTPLLALENLVVQGFELPNMRYLFDENEIKLTLKHLANFHAVGFIYKQKYLDRFTNSKKYLKHFFLDLMESNKFQMLLNGLFRIMQDVVKNCGNEDLITKYNACAKNFVEMFKSSSEYNGPYGTFVHGDCWTNNLMFKYKEENNKKIPVDIKIFDWQTVHYGSPVIDISYILYSSAGKNDLDNLEELLKYYYYNFAKVIEKFSYDPETVYPYSALKKQWKHYGRYGFILSFEVIEIKVCNGSPIVDTEYEDSATEEEIVNLIKSKIDVKEYQERMFNLITHVYNEGIL